MCSSSYGNFNFLYSVTNVDGFICLLSITTDSLDILSTHPFSCITREVAESSSISSIGLSPDRSVVFAVDNGLQCILRIELKTGNCRSFGNELACKYTSGKLFFNTCLIQADTIGLSFTADSLLLHQGYKTVAVTSMGMVITTLLRKVYCVEVASSSDFLVTSG